MMEIVMPAPWTERSMEQDLSAPLSWLERGFMTVFGSLFIISPLL